MSDNSPPRIGHLLPTRDLAAAGDDDVRGLVDLARLGEDLGLDSVWAGDSPLTRPRADAVTVLAAVAAVTGRVTLGTAVLLPALRHPTLLAHQLATLDRLAGGRLVVGLGAGFPHPVTRAQFAALGVDYARRTALLEAAISELRRLWSLDPPPFAPRPVQPGGPPLWLAGAGPAALRRVARLADGWLPYPVSPAGYAAGLAGLGGVTPALYATVCLDTGAGRARERLRAGVERYYRAPLEAVEAVQLLVAGPPEVCAERLAGFVAAGARHLVVRFVADDHRCALEAFAAEVAPALRRPAQPAGAAQ